MTRVVPIVAVLALLSLFGSCEGGSNGPVAGPGWKSQDVSRRRLGGEEGGPGKDSQAEASVPGPAWPDEMLGIDEWTDYVGPVRVLHEGVASCAGIRAAVGTKPTKVIARGHVGPSDIATLSRHHDGIESPPPFRLMVWVAKNGLGNTIRGFLSTFFYAFLSGRQLVRSPEGSHGKVMRSLCHGFKCPYVDVLHFKGRLPRMTANMCHRRLENTLRDPRPVMVGDCDVLLTFWAYNASLRQCVLDSFGCQDEWCAMSRAELLLLGSPSEVLGEVINESMTLVPALDMETGRQSAMGQGETGADQGETGRGQGETGTGQGETGTGQGAGRRLLGAETGSNHRTGSEEAGEMHPRRVLNSWTKELTTMFLQGPQTERQQKKEEQQEPQQQQQLQPGGQRVPSSVAKTATSLEQTTSSVSADIVPRSLRLRFDLALHIRTLYRCVEKSANGRGCQAGDLNHAIAVAEFSSELRKFVHTYDWECISQLLAFLRNLKFPPTSERQAHSEEHGSSDSEGSDPGGQAGQSQRGPHRLFGSPDDEGKLQQFVRDSSRFQASRKVASTPWTVEKARQVASQASGAGEALGTGEGTSSARKLSIFLATDSEVLRPLFVEFLRPFGHVVFSKGRVVHLDRGTGEERLRLPTVAEFFLLSKASVLVSFTRRMSSFLHHAAMYGNGTLISRGGDSGCKYLLDHVAQRIRTT